MGIKASEALGNIESFVDMMSAASGVPTYKLEGWLDVYFKLRVLACLEEEETAEENDGRMISAPTPANEPISLTVNSVQEETTADTAEEAAESCSQKKTQR